MTLKAAASPSGWAVIGDLVASRRAASRARVQADLLDALERTNRLVPASQSLAATIGDEFQGLYDTIESAMLAGLVVRLALPADADARVGIAHGHYEVVGATDYGLSQDGPAWWDARAAIDELKRRERRQPALRTWVHAGPEENPMSDPMSNAYAMTRDHIVSGFDARQRRLVLGVIEGSTQRELAEAEGVSASAVSQSLRRSGARAVLDGLRLLEAR